MPFDALLAPPRPRLLVEILDELGATPVPLEALAAHKQAQLERFAPSFWHQHQTWLPVGLIGSVVCMAMSGGIANGVLPGSLLPSWLSLFWLGVMTLLIVFGVFRVQRRRALGGTPASPAEALVELGVPSPIAAAGARPAARGCRARRWSWANCCSEEVVLDPYLLLERDGRTRLPGHLGRPADHRGAVRWLNDEFRCALPILRGTRDRHPS